jgi:hypothetical protein
LIYLIDRYYDPSTDQFLSVDPDVTETGQPYAFTGDDPLNATDPLGMMINLGPGRGIAGNSAASATAAVNLDTKDQINAVIANSGAYYAKENAGATSDLPVKLGLMAGMLVPGFDDGPDEALIIGEGGVEGAAAEGGIDASGLRMTSTVEQHIGELAKDGTLARPYADSTLTIQNIIDSGTPVPDPGGVPGAVRWDVPGTLNGSSGTWQLVVDRATNTILHFQFQSG